VELLIDLLRGFVAAHEVAQATVGVYQWICDRISNWSRRAPAQEVQEQVEKLAKVSESEIRQVAAMILAQGGASISGERREELIGILLNLTRGARFLTTHGTPRSSYLRCERLLDQLMSDVQPVRRWGEPVAPGQPWVLQRYLGMGSFGEVWLARNPLHPTPRAYKFFTRPGSGEWLRHEQQNLSQLLKRLGEHDHIIDFIDAQVDGRSIPFLALEYVGGGSLEDWIVEDPDRRARLDPHEIIRGVVSGLAAASAQQIAHRDLKPANILLTEGPDVQAKIGDFGLAKVAATTKAGSSAQASLGVLVGTPMYLPPEAQGAGRRSPFQDDIFALGVIWYQMIVGALERPPYDFAERLRAHGADAHTIGLIERCLAHPSRRLPNAVALEVALGDVIPGVVECPPGQLDVQHLAREYLATLAR
jgi:hypothetical protein